MLAFWLEREFSKDEILTIYLNRAYFGAGAYGVDAAARRYFGRSARDLGTAQAAMIAGLLKAPSRYSPANDLGLARRRAGTVVEAMVDAGFLADDAGAAARAAVKALKVAPRAGPAAGHFVDWVLEQVPGYVGRDHGALHVRTTLDPARQRAAQAALTETLAAVGTQRNIGQGALVALDRDGAVRAMVGGRDHARSVFNRATQAKRQPGSAFKAVVYLAGLEAGLRPDDVIEDAPITLGGWSPRNYDGRFRGPVTVREGFARSINTVAVRVGMRAGVKRVRAAARRLGIESALPADASIALGTGEVTLLELTAAYVALANGGVRALPHGIVEIRNRAGDVLYRRAGSGAGRAADADAVAAMGDLLAAAVADGTGRAAALPQALGRTYGKTGTSQNFRDAWFRRLGRRAHGRRLARQRRRHRDGRGDRRRLSGRNLAALHGGRAALTVPARPPDSRLPDSPSAGLPPASGPVDQVDEGTGDAAGAHAGVAEGRARRVVDGEERAIGGLGDHAAIVELVAAVGGPRLAERAVRRQARVAVAEGEALLAKTGLQRQQAGHGRGGGRRRR